jgi:DNA-binding response OmpR family regulator
VGCDGYVLVVDDDPDLRESIGVVLAAAGHAFMTAVDGADALRRLRGDGGRPCVVLLDLMMPRMNGFELRTVMKADSSLARIPVIVLTGAGTLVDIRGAELEAEILRKPVEVRHLLSAVERHCGKDGSQGSQGGNGTLGKKSRVPPVVH